MDGAAPAQILQPVQVASFAVQAYPYFPDLLALLALLAEGQGEQANSQFTAADRTAWHPVEDEQEAGPAPAVLHSQCA